MKKTTQFGVLAVTMAAVLGLTGCGRSGRSQQPAMPATQVHIGSNPQRHHHHLGYGRRRARTLTDFVKPFEEANPDATDQGHGHSLGRRPETNIRPRWPVEHPRHRDDGGRPGCPDSRVPSRHGPTDSTPPASSKVRSASTEFGGTGRRCAVVRGDPRDLLPFGPGERTRAGPRRPADGTGSRRSRQTYKDKAGAVLRHSIPAGGRNSFLGNPAVVWSNGAEIMTRRSDRMDAGHARDRRAPYEFLRGFFADATRRRQTPT